MPYDSIISRSDADSLIPQDVAGELIAAATQQSAAPRLTPGVDHFLDQERPNPPETPRVGSPLQPSS